MKSRNLRKKIGAMVRLSMSRGPNRVSDNTVSNNAVSDNTVSDDAQEWRSETDDGLLHSENARIYDDLHCLLCAGDA